jgi:hypothetical protein
MYRVWRKPLMPHRNGRWEALHWLKRAFFLSILVVHRKPPHPHKECYSNILLVLGWGWLGVLVRQRAIRIEEKGEGFENGNCCILASWFTFQP